MSIDKKITYRKVAKKGNRGFYKAIVGYGTISLVNASSDEVNNYIDGIHDVDDRIETTLKKYESECLEVLKGDPKCSAIKVSGDAALVGGKYKPLSNEWLAAEVLRRVLSLRETTKLAVDLPEKVSPNKVALAAIMLERAWHEWDFIKHYEYDLLAKKESRKGGKKSGKCSSWHVVPGM